jgi:hypothetical protein
MIAIKIPIDGVVRRQAIATGQLLALTAQGRGYDHT